MLYGLDKDRCDVILQTADIYKNCAQVLGGHECVLLTKQLYSQRQIYTLTEHSQIEHKRAATGRIGARRLEVSGGHNASR